MTVLAGGESSQAEEVGRKRGYRLPLHRMPFSNSFGSGVEVLWWRAQ